VPDRSQKLSDRTLQKLLDRTQEVSVSRREAAVFETRREPARLDR